MPIRRNSVVIAIVMAACTTPPPSTSARPAGPPAGPAPTSPAPRDVDARPPQCCDPAPTHRDQTPDIKLKLGHFANKRRGIGLVFDRSAAQAKLRFDGSTEIVKVDPETAGMDRTDFIRSLGHVALQLWADGRVVVFVGGDEIDVVRDGDADPL
jgi:hypothetical protein